MTRFSTPILALSLLLPGCLVSHHDEALLVDASAQDDAGASDASVAADEVHSSVTLAPARISAQAHVSHAARTQGTPAAEVVRMADKEQTSAPLENSKDGTAVPGASAQVPSSLTAAQAPSTSATAALDATDWQREVLPASLVGVDTKPYDPNLLGSDTCRGVMTEGQLCTCLTGTIDPEYADSYGASCSHRSLGVPGVGVFSDRSYGTHVTVQKDGGWYRLADIDSPGYSMFEATGARLMHAGRLPVLAIQMGQSSGCTNDSWELEIVQLCALREPNSADFGRCITVPVNTVWSTWIPETDKTVSTRSRVGFRLTSRGTVVVHAKGKIKHDDVKKSLGEHKL